MKNLLQDCFMASAAVLIVGAFVTTAVALGIRIVLFINPTLGVCP